MLAAIAVAVCAARAVASGPPGYGGLQGAPYTVGWNSRGLTIDGAPQMILSGDVHYARAQPEEQDAALDKLAADSLNTVQTYTFWSVHEPEPGAWCWGTEDASSSAACAAAGQRANITRFLDSAAQKGLFVILRIGPFICGEWTYGGIPTWVNGLSDVQIRAHNPSWESAMTTVVQTIWSVVEPYTAAHGGPIIMLQLENENGAANPADPYVQYVAALAGSLDTRLPFLWCEGGWQQLVPFAGPTANGTSVFVPAVNGNDGADYADALGRASPQFPLLWTENEGWYHPWGSSPIDGGAGVEGVGAGTATASVVGEGSRQPLVQPTSNWGTVENPDRSPEDLATAVARWVARGGAMMNYYMYYGGQHFGTAAAAGVLNSYADGVNLRSDGLDNEPKRSHMAALHALVLRQHRLIMATPRPIPASSLGGEGLTAYAFGPGGDLAFLENANGNPGGGGVGGSPRSASATGEPRSCTFPVDTSKQRFKGLSAAPSAFTEAACAAACCAESAPKCAAYEWYADKSPGQSSQCWIGVPTRSQGTPPAGFVGRARHAIDPSPPPPPPHGAATVQWKGHTYLLPQYSVTIVNGSTGAVLFETRNTSSAPRTNRVFTAATQSPLTWACWSELEQLQSSTHPGAVWSPEPLEQLNLTHDRTEFLVYTTRVPAPPPSSRGTALADAAGTTPMTLTLNGRRANAYTVFVNGALVGNVWDAAHSWGPKAFTIPLKLSAAATADAGLSWDLAILSTSIGMMSHVTKSGLEAKGIIAGGKGPAVSLGGADITTPKSGWTHLVGLAGERLGAAAGNASLGWGACPGGDGTSAPPLLWRKATFRIDAATLSNQSISVMLDVSGMSRGHFYLNGHDLGKFWTVGGTQRYYQLPRSLLRADPTVNLLVLADELGATDPSGVRVVLSTMQRCDG